jgi:Flp pilus assembly pilin Flp
VQNGLVSFAQDPFMAEFIHSFLKQDDGQTLFEYALVLLFIAMAVIIILTLLGQTLLAFLQNVAQGI